MPNTDCLVVAAEDKLKYETMKKLYSLDAIHSLDEFIGRPEEGTKNYHWHQKLYNVLYEHIMEIGNDIRSWGQDVGDSYYKRDRKTFESLTKDTLPYRIVDAMASYLETIQGYLDVDILQRGKMSMQTAYNLAYRGIQLKKKEISSVTRTLLPQDYVTFRLEGTGTVKKVTEFASKVDDNWRALSLPYEHIFEAINTSLNSYLELSISNKNLNDYLLGPIDNVEIYTGDRKKTERVSLLKVNYDTNGEIKDFTVKDSLGATFSIDKDRFITREKNTIDGIKGIILEKGTLDFVNDLGHGQAKRIFANNDPSKHLNEISWLLIANNKKMEIKEASPYVLFKDVGDIRYSYVTVKDKTDEKHYFYLVGHKKGKARTVPYFQFNEKTGKYTPNKFRDNIDINSVMEEYIKPDGTKGERKAFRDGFYRADAQKVYGHILNKKFQKMSDDAVLKEYANFQYMDNQPKEKLLYTDDKRQLGIMQAVAKKREVYKELAQHIKRMLATNKRELDYWFNKAVSKLGTNSFEGKRHTDSIVKMLDDLKNFGIRNNIWYDENTDSIQSINDEFYVKEDYFGPIRFSKQVRDKFSDIETAKLEKQLESDELSDKERKKLQTQLDHMQNIQDFNKGDTVALERSPHAIRHWKPYTDNTLRRKDSDTDREYLHSLFSSYMKNRLLIESVKAIHDMSSIAKTGDMINIEAIEYMMNVVKSSVGDLTADVKMFGINVGIPRMTELFNKYLGSGWTNETVEKRIQHLKGLMSSMLLGMSPALPNRAQRFNRAFMIGLEPLRIAHTALNGKETDTVLGMTPSQVKKLMQYYGANNMITALNDAVMTNFTDLKWSDRGWTPLPIQIFGLRNLPTMNLARYFVLLKMSKKDFMNTNTPKLDKMLLSIPSNLKLKIGTRLVERSAVKAGSREEIELTQYLKSTWHDLITMDEKDSKNEELVKRRVENLFGKIADMQMMKFVSWKLSWWFNKYAKDTHSMFTFTGVEENNRMETAFAAIYVLDKMGAFGYSEKLNKDGIPERLLSKKAVDAARVAIATLQFNMSQTNQGEGFRGAGALILQYKDFVVKQTMLGRNMRLAFKYGTGDLAEGRTIKDKIENVHRFMAGMKLVLSGKSKKIQYGEQGIDYEAIARVRHLMTRGIATTASILYTELKDAIYIMNFIARTNFDVNLAIGNRINNAKFGLFGLGDVMSGTKGAESPVFSVIGRVLLRWIFYLMIAGFDGGDDDKKDKTGKSAFRKTVDDTMRFLIMPIFSISMGVLLRQIREIVDSQED